MKILNRTKNWRETISRRLYEGGRRGNMTNVGGANKKKAFTFIAANNIQ